MPRESKENLPWSGPMGGVQELGGEAKAGQVWLADWLRSRETLRLTWDSSAGQCPSAQNGGYGRTKALFVVENRLFPFFRDIL